jgi:recombination protein RecR
MKQYPTLIHNLIENLKKIPTIGNKNAERIAFFFLYSNKDYLLSLSDNLKNIHTQLKFCRICFSFVDHEDICDVCASPFRDKSVICVVESFKDRVTFEELGDYQGLYHILQGKLAPLDGVTPDKLKIKELVERVKDTKVKEVIMATSLDLEGDATAYYLFKLLEPFNIKVTRLAKGLPFGSEIEYVDLMSLRNSLKNREVLQ